MTDQRGREGMVFFEGALEVDQCAKHHSVGGWWRKGRYSRGRTKEGKRWGMKSRESEELKWKKQKTITMLIDELELVDVNIPESCQQEYKRRKKGG